MRLVYLTCILLASTICSFASGGAIPTGDNNTASQQAKDTTTAVPPINSPTSVDTVISSSVAPNVTNSTTHITPNTTNNTSDVTTSNPAKPTEPPTKPTVAPTNQTTTPVPTTTTTTKTTTSTTQKPTTSSPIKPTTPTNAPSTTSASATTAVPVSTKVAPGPDDSRHFDGLSFVGGIFLAVCLMAIGVFTWKFFRTMNERHYRTL
ncbi:uncharacterized protein LOC143180527 [Calliopsis andreniformis]|uniref:uncharacterized protein LOC143180527 n=1 Tax=Calliopsis andreniformis TaxID=337506 RepID=UPI003FCD4F60